jgi:hypothetical protein
MTPADVEAIVKSAAKESTLETLKVLGFNVEDPIEMRKDMNHLRRSRAFVENAARGMSVALGAALLSAIGYGILHWAGHG